MKLLYRPAAREDLRAIYWSTADRWGLKQADTYDEALQTAAESLTENPRRGQRFDGLRFIPSGKHLLFYTVSDEAVIIVRILHERMHKRAKLRALPDASR